MKKNILVGLLFLSCFMLQAQIGIGTPSPNPSAVLELNSTIKGFLPPLLTTVQRDGIASPAAGLMIYNMTKNCLEWYDGTVWFNGCGSQDSSGGTAIVSGYSCSKASGGTLIEATAVFGVTQTITATVVKVGTFTISAVANGVTFSAVGTFAATGLQDIVLTASGIPITAGNYNFILSGTPNCNFSRLVDLGTANASCNASGTTTVVPVTSDTGKIWMDRNLGASRAGTSATDYQAYGCLYQWGRGNDGHANISWTSSSNGKGVNGVSNTTSATDTPFGDSFIAIRFTPLDWRSPQNDQLWQGLSGTNNPCPSGYRIPTDLEFASEITQYNITDSKTAYSSPLKFVVAGNRIPDNGMMANLGFRGYYWSSAVNGTNAVGIFFSSGSVSNAAPSNRASGYSVRCIKN